MELAVGVVLFILAVLPGLLKWNHQVPGHVQPKSAYDMACDLCPSDPRTGLKWFREAMKKEAHSSPEKAKLVRRALSDPDLVLIWREILSEFGDVLKS